MQYHCIRRISNLAQKVLIVDHAAEPREDSQVFVVVSGTNQKENIGQLPAAAEAEEPWRVAGVEPADRVAVECRCRVRCRALDLPNRPLEQQ